MEHKNCIILKQKTDLHELDDPVKNPLLLPRKK